MQSVYLQQTKHQRKRATSLCIKTELDSPIPETPIRLSPEINTQSENIPEIQKHREKMEVMNTFPLSPGNNDSIHQFFENSLSQPYVQHLQHQQYQQQFQSAQFSIEKNKVSSAQSPSLGHNPLTPPGLPTVFLPSTTLNFCNTESMRLTQATMISQSLASHFRSKSLELNEKLQFSLTPRNTPPIDITPPKSPKSLPSLSIVETHSYKDQDMISNSSEDVKNIGGSEDDDSIRIPIYNSHGKMKNYKCKACGFVAITKIAFWEHARVHMKPEKMLPCPKCPFVTELKHHLEYHIRKHKNLKPFQCDKCQYSCVNKSMLNSHRKSHSTVYQYRCADCDYATKYCHSFKLHLRKYDHRPGMVLDEEGVPNPSIIIDVYGTRRGPKSKSASYTTAKRTEGASDHKFEQYGSGNTPKQRNGMSPARLSAVLQRFSIPNSTITATVDNSEICSNPPNEQWHKTVHEVDEKFLQYQQPQNRNEDAKGKSQQQPQLSHLLPQLASLFQHNSLLPYLNINLQVLAAQQQAAVMAQLSPQTVKTTTEQQQEPEKISFTGGSENSAMDLTQNSVNENVKSKTIVSATVDHKWKEDAKNQTPQINNTNSSRRKGRALKLDLSPNSKIQFLCSPDMEIHETEVSENHRQETPKVVADASFLPDDKIGCLTTTTARALSSPITSFQTSTCSNVSPTATSLNEKSALGTGNSSSCAIFECKYCDILFKDAVLYTIHMGYHSCDDVFKCNMCGEKCESAVGLFVHMARMAHS